MATGGGFDRSRGYGFSGLANRNNSPDDRLSSRSDHYQENRNNSYGHQRTTDPDNMTLEHSVKNKIRQGQQINRPTLEIEVTNIKHQMNPDQYDIDQWKRRLPQDVKNCRDSILRVSMAYGNNPQQIKPILQAKMNETNSNNDPTDTSLDNIREPLKRLQKDLERNPPPNIFHAVRNIDGQNIDRADRLFLSEAYHLAPGLKEYTFDDAHNAVQAIRDTNYETNRPDAILPIIKTYREVEEIREHLERSSKTSTDRDESPPPRSTTTTTTRVFDDDRRTNPHPSINDRNPNFPYKPMPNPYQQSPQSSSRPFQESDNRSSGNPSRRNIEKN